MFSLTINLLLWQNAKPFPVYASEFGDMNHTMYVRCVTDIFSTRQCIPRVLNISPNHLNWHHIFCDVIGDSICYVMPSVAFLNTRHFFAE